jgi:hypothetical protein
MRRCWFDLMKLVSIKSRSVLTRSVQKRCYCTQQLQVIEILVIERTRAATRASSSRCVGGLMSHKLKSRTKSFTPSMRSILCDPTPTSSSSLRSTSERFRAAPGAAELVAFFDATFGHAGRFKAFTGAGAATVAEASEAVDAGGPAVAEAAADAEPCSLREEDSCSR